MMRITVIIPNFNNSKWLKRCLDSVISQTYQPEEILIIDDCSTDESKEIIKDYWTRYFGLISPIKIEDKRYNGGARNEGIDCAIGNYTMFLDSDDYLIDDKVLEDIAVHDDVDCIRLSYTCEGQEGRADVILNDKSLSNMVGNPNVACWLKVVKTELLPRFPENTLMEDVVFHLKLMDKIESYYCVGRPCVVWNRLNTNSVSTSNSDKWCSSLYRYYADLLDLKLNKPYCENERLRRIENAYRNIKNDRFMQE